MHPGLKCPLQQGAVVFCRIKRGMMRKNHAAKITVRPQLAVLLVPWNRIGLDALGPVQYIGRALKRVKMFGAMGGVILATTGEIAVQLLGLDELFQPVQGIKAFLPNGAGLCGIIAAGQFFQTGLDAGADLAVVSGATTPAGIASLQNHR